MSINVISPAKAFLNFNPAPVGCDNQAESYTLPAWHDFYIRSQVKINGTRPITDKLYLAICDSCVPCTQDNIVTNGTFDDALTGWTADDFVHEYGRAAFKFTVGCHSGSVRQQTTHYSGHFRVKLKYLATTDFDIVLRVYDGGTILDEIVIPTEYDGAWHVLDNQFFAITSPSTNPLTFLFACRSQNRALPNNGCNATGEATEGFYFDDLEVYKTDTCNILEDLDIELKPACSDYSWQLSNEDTGLDMCDPTTWITIPGTAYNQVLNIVASESGEGYMAIPTGIYTASQFYAMLSTLLGITVDSCTIAACCNLPGIKFTYQDGLDSDYGHYYGSGNQVEVELKQYWNWALVEYPQKLMEGVVPVNGCFRYCILDEAKNVVACSNVFKRIPDPCYTTQLEYYCNEHAYGFRYFGAESSSIIRVPIYFRAPEYPVEEKVYRQTDGRYRRLSTTIEKEWEGITDSMPQGFHDKLVTALKHDVVKATNQLAYMELTQITVMGQYDMNWADPWELGWAKFKARLAFDSKNSNCKSSPEDCCLDNSTPTLEAVTEEVTNGTDSGTFNLAIYDTEAPAGYTWLLLLKDTQSGTQYTVTSDSCLFTVAGLPCSEYSYVIYAQSGCQYVSAYTGLLDTLEACGESSIEVTLVQIGEAGTEYVDFALTFAPCETASMMDIQLRKGIFTRTYADIPISNTWRLDQAEVDSLLDSGGGAGLYEARVKTNCGDGLSGTYSEWTPAVIIIM